MEKLTAEQFADLGQRLQESYAGLSPEEKEQMKLRRAASLPTLGHDEQVQPIFGPLQLMERVATLGRKGMQIQRYKGLGEMNPEQLWETTLDPTKRSMVQVKVDHADEADEIFTTLMGDVVDPRRDFIQSNALRVVNLDV